MDNYTMIAERQYRFVKQAVRRPEYRTRLSMPPPPLPELPSASPSPRDFDPVDILLPLGSGSKCGNAELRFALRSICKFATGYNRLVIVGNDPGFLASHPRLVFHPLAEANHNHEANIALKLQWAMHNAVSSYAALWNDDYVLCEPVNVRALPFYHKGELATLSRQKSSDRYRRALDNTSQMLEASGRETLNYDVHVPMIFNASLFCSLSAWWERSAKLASGLVVKSVYGNIVLPQPGERIKDCKLKGFDGATFLSKTAGRWVYSYGDAAFEGGLMKHLERQFPDKCEYEA